MATDPYLLERIENFLHEKKVAYVNKRMFGGNCIMVDEKMCFAALKMGLMVRVGVENVEELVQREGAAYMMQKGKNVMKGFLIVSPEGFDLEEDLEFWIQKCLDFNPLAKKSKKKGG